MHRIPELDARGLRHFALSTSAIIAILFGLLLPWVLGLGFPIWPWPLASLLAIWGIAAPASLRPVYRGWMRFGLAIGRVTTPVILTMVFFLLFLPTAIILRLAGKDPMRRDLRTERASYREASHSIAPKSMEKPY